MNCESVRNVLDLHLEGRLTPSRAAKVEAHVAHCRACREAAAAASPLEARRAPSAPASLKAGLAALLEKGAEPASRGLRFHESPLASDTVLVLELAAALSVLLFLFNLLGPGVPSQSLPDPDVAQVEARP